MLFLDEVHRFNKAQQDAFLPHVEEGTLTFIGATTENPSFEIDRRAAVARARLRAQGLSAEELQQLLQSALARSRARARRAAADDRGRCALALLAHAPTAMRAARSACSSWPPDSPRRPAAAHHARRRRRRSPSGGRRRFDKGGEQFYDQISALHKAVRGSDPDAALYWLARMLDGGCDPHYLARRIMRMAIEDIGLADPRALQLALDAWQTYERLGSPRASWRWPRRWSIWRWRAKSNAVYARVW